MEVYAAQGNWPALDALIQSTLTLDPANETARRLAEEASRRPANTVPGHETLTAEKLLDMSVQYCKEGKYPECLAAAQKALELRPAYAEAYNNMAAAYMYMKMWDEGILAARQALTIKPDYVSARRNLQWAVAHRNDPPGAK